MMKHLSFSYAISMLLLAALPAGAQEVRNQIALLEADAATAIFAAEGIGSSRDDAVENAKQAVLRKLLFEGIEGLGDEKPIVVDASQLTSNLWLKGFFDGKTAPYKNFIGGVELVGDFTTNEVGEYKCNTHVIVKHNQLLNQSATQGITRSAADIKQQTTPATQTAPPKKKSFL